MPVPWLRMSLAPGTKLGCYEIKSPIGAGGMGEVYRATDSKLGRDVALKVLPAMMADDVDRLARFRREAKALAQLDHPNIVTIYSVEEFEGIHFLTMQLVAGLPLDRVMPTDGLPVDQIVDIAGALGDALAAAHEKGIIHRDLKPANVMVSTDGRVKVLDFGLAKEIRESNPGGATMTSANQTQAGMVMGTPAYMSPEQIAGRDLDHRSDIFSLGVLLHEMATGQRPFAGASTAELASAILRDSPASVTDIRPELPADMARIIRRCLEKDPRHRVQTARDVCNEFRDLSRQTASQSQKSAIQSQAQSSIAAPSSGSTRADEGFWVAVLPFKYSGPNAEISALAEGLSDEVVTGLSRFSYLRVIARGATAHYATQSIDLRTVGKELGARYILEGNIRQAGSKLRIAVQLVDTADGAHLWAQTYERNFTADAIFDLQDDIVPRIVSTIADQYGVLPRSMSSIVRAKNVADLTPHEAVLYSFGYFERISAEEHARIRDVLEAAVAKAPNNADCWAMLSLIYRGEHAQEYNPRPDPLGRAQDAAQRAIQLAPSSHLGHWSLAVTLFFLKEPAAFRAVAERAMALNPYDGSALSLIGLMTASTGDWEGGVAMINRAMEVNPNHPGHYYFAPAAKAYRDGQYETALEFVLKANMPNYFFAAGMRAATFGKLGRTAAAQKALQEALTLRPGFATSVRRDYGKWFPDDFVDDIVDGLLKAGMEIPDTVGAAAAPPKSAAIPDATPSGALRADEGFWVAVLPFKYSGTNADVASLADGISDEIITGMSHFPYLHVIARGSTARYKNEAIDPRTIGKELGARYVIDGNLRLAAATLRVAVQLVDCTSGAQLWAHTYERAFSSETIFALQDELVPIIVSTIADAHGVLPHTMAEPLRDKKPEDMSPLEAVLAGFRYAERLSAEEYMTARIALERAVQIAPGYSYGWAMLSILLTNEFRGPNRQPDSLDRALHAARRAVELDATNHRAYHALATVHFSRKDFPAFRTAAERAIALNHMDGCCIADMGAYLSYAGDWEHGIAYVKSALELNPHHPGWYWFGLSTNAYRLQDYSAALDFALKINIPGFPATYIVLAMNYGQLGQRESAQNALEDLLKLAPNAASVMRPLLSMTYQPEMVEHMIDGLRKAGLEVEPALA